MKKDRIKIMYEDKFIIVIDKPAHLLSIATEKEKEQTMYHKVLMYERQKNKKNRIYIVHRLDKDTSGLLLFAKDEKTKNYFQNHWDSVVRNYIAIVEGKIEKTERLTLPDSYISRSFVFIKKVKPTRKAYPRKAGTANKQPL